MRIGKETEMCVMLAKMGDASNLAVCASVGEDRADTELRLCDSWPGLELICEKNGAVVWRKQKANVWLLCEENRGCVWFMEEVWGCGWSRVETCCLCEIE